MSRILLLMVSLLLLVAPALSAEPRLRPASWATPVLAEHLENGYRVDARLFRSAQPDAAGMHELEQLGIKRVLNLREYHDDQDENGATGLELFRVPMNAATIRDAEVVAALRIILASEEPILVHCWHGSDRTGTVVAMYRMVVQEWPREAALDELVNGGYGYHAVYGNIPDYLEQVDLEKIRRQLRD